MNPYLNTSIKLDQTLEGTVIEGTAKDLTDREETAEKNDDLLKLLSKVRKRNQSYA
jgi:hypothetical protein